ncbi:protein draper-like [Saccostrea cucullata]|uniref:protein draper-like n=1 Tax=Saccostrea cuccullata TaxID=36930 RepID=UPI002ED5AD33
MIVISSVHNAKQLGIIPIEPKCIDSYLSSENLRCCTSYRTIGGKCYPCIGSFGLECSKPCPKGYYGLKCQEKCECDRCNATTGNCFHEKNSSSNVRGTSIEQNLLLSKRY